jgi:hypothetical protein
VLTAVGACVISLTIGTFLFPPLSAWKALEVHRTSQAEFYGVVAKQAADLSSRLTDIDLQASKLRGLGAKTLELGDTFSGLEAKGRAVQQDLDDLRNRLGSLQLLLSEIQEFGLVRVLNDTGETLNDVRMAFKGNALTFAELKPGDPSKYIPVALPLRSIPVSAKTASGRELESELIDSLGETALPAGKYTYRLYLDGGGILRLDVREDAK